MSDYTSLIHYYAHACIHQERAYELIMCTQERTYVPTHIAYKMHTSYYFNEFNIGYCSYVLNLTLCIVSLDPTDSQKCMVLYK